MDSDAGLDWESLCQPLLALGLGSGWPLLSAFPLE